MVFYGIAIVLLCFLWQNRYFAITLLCVAQRLERECLVTPVPSPESGCLGHRLLPRGGPELFP